MDKRGKKNMMFGHVLSIQVNASSCPLKKKKVKYLLSMIHVLFRPPTLSLFILFCHLYLRCRTIGFTINEGSFFLCTLRSAHASSVCHVEGFKAFLFSVPHPSTLWSPTIPYFLNQLIIIKMLGVWFYFVFGSVTITKLLFLYFGLIMGFMFLVDTSWTCSPHAMEEDKYGTGMRSLKLGLFIGPFSSRINVSKSLNGKTLLVALCLFFVF